MKIRCKISVEGKQRIYTHSRYQNNRRGYIIGGSKDGRCWKVLWDDRKSAESVHKDFICEDTQPTDNLIQQLKASEIF